MTARHPHRALISVALAASLLILAACGGGGVDSPSRTGVCPNTNYPDLATSAYVLPYRVGESHATGLTHCATSFHAQGQPDQFAVDFQMPEGTPFVAARAGTVTRVENSAPSGGGGAGNWVAVDHGDGTSALYLHSPLGGISGRLGDAVTQGQVLGITGRSGLAGYPHLHFIVVRGSIDFPYAGFPVAFRNASPADAALKGDAAYAARPY